MLRIFSVRFRDESPEVCGDLLVSRVGSEHVEPKCTLVVALHILCFYIDLCMSVRGEGRGRERARERERESSESIKRTTVGNC